MENLEELRIYDTKLSLMDLPNIFKACPKLTKLSFSLAERNMDRYQEGVMEKSSLDSVCRFVPAISFVNIVLFIKNGGCLVILGVLK